MTELKFTLALTGALRPRRIDAEDAIIALTELVARREAIRGRVGSGLRQVFGGLMDRVVEVLGALEAASVAGAPVAPAATTAPPSALTALAPVAVLSDARGMNNLIDLAVGALDTQLSGAAAGFAVDPRTQAAQRVRERVFPDGKGFLALSHKRQWLEVRRRFDASPPEVTAALEVLGLGEDFARIAALNAWFGRLLGVTEAVETARPAAELAADPREVLARAHGEFLALAVELVAFANVAWPGDDLTASSDRLALVGPYLGPLQRQSAARSADARRRAASTPAAPTDG